MKNHKREAFLPKKKKKKRVDMREVLSEYLKMSIKISVSYPVPCTSSFSYFEKFHFCEVFVKY